GVLAVLLPDVGEVSAATENGIGTAGIAATAEVLGVGEEGAPLGLQEVDDPQVLPELFELGACGGKEVHVGVAGPPSLRRQIGHPPDPEGELALPRVDPHGLAEWFVLEPAGDLDVDVAAGKPTLTGAVDIGVGLLAEADIPADVVVPAVKVLRHVVVVTVGLVRNAFW